MKLQNPDNFNPEKVLLRERTLTLASWPNKAKSDHHPSFIYSRFLKATLSFTFKSKTCAVAYFQQKKSNIHSVGEFTCGPHCHIQL